MKRLISLILLGAAILAMAKNRDPKDYPQSAKVVAFQRQPCMKRNKTRPCHFITFQIEGKTLTGSCSSCDPLLPGQTYPARLDRKQLVLYVIHQKSNGSWGQDNYEITEMAASEEK